MKRKIPDEIGILAVLVLVGLILSLMSPQFFTASNLSTLLLNATVIALLSIGETFVLLTAGIDLSVGSGIALSGVLSALILEHHGSMWLALMAAVVSTLLVGLFNGLIIHYVKVPPFIVTFATMSVAASIPMIVTQANPIAITRESFGNLGSGYLMGVPVPVIILAVIAILAYILLSKTVVGMQIYAVGGNRESARLAGVNTARVDLLVYLVSGFTSGVCGIIDASRLMSGYPTAGSGNDLFFSIAAAVVGGVSLFGGIGSVGGALIGAVLIGTISDGLNILNVSSYWQPLVIGVIILIGVTFDTLRTSQRLNLSFWSVLSSRLRGRAQPLS
jgi:ribose transport system permease protein